MTAALVRMDDVWLPPPQAPSGLPVASPLGGAMLMHVVNPMVPQLGLRRFGHCNGMTVLEAVTAAGWRLPKSTVLLRGGIMVRRSEWDVTPIGAAELVVLVTLPQGKGGASQIIAAIATIALAIFAPQIGLLLLGKELAGTVAFAGITWGSLATVGIVLAGSMIISAVLPKPKALTNNANQGTQNPSYSLSGQANTARLLQPIPERFGRFKFLPDLAAQASFDFVNSQQELNEEFCLGMGLYDIEEIGVASTPIWKKTDAHPDGDYTGNYAEIEAQILAPGEANTLFSNNQVTSGEVSNVELLGTNQEGYGWIGPYVLNPANTLCRRIEVDFSAPSGLFKVDASGNLKSATASFEVQVREIDALGAPVDGAAWLTVIDQTISQATRDAIRTTYGANLPPARYQVQFQRTNAKSTDTATADAIGILSMRGILPNSAAQPDTTRIALKARSTRNLNGDAAQRFYVIATRKLPIPSIDEGTGAITWSAAVATRSWAWAAAYLCYSQNGLRKPDSKIAIAKLIALDAIAQARGDYFDGVFDDGASAWTALQTICRVGRAEPRRIGRYIDFNRDEKKLIPKAAFGPASMLSGSFNIDYLMFDDASKDGCWIDYVDARNWEPNSVYCALPDSDVDPNDAPHIPFTGLTDRDHAWREGIFICAVNRWRRTFPNWRTELEGRVCFRGDKIVVAHWLFRTYGGGAVYLARATGGDIVTLSEPWDHQKKLNSDTPMLSLVTPDGYEWGPVPVAVLDDGEVSAQAQVRLLATAQVLKGKYAGQQPRDWPVWDGEGLDLERPRAMWGTATQKRRNALMVAMKPESGNNVTMAAVIDDDRVHYADGTIPPLDPDDDVPAPPDETNPPTATGLDDLTITAVTVAEINQAGGVVVPPQLSFTVLGAQDAVSFDARWKWNDAADFSPEQRGLGRIFQIATVSGQLTLQVRAEGKSGFGGWFNVTTAAVGVPPDPSAAPSGLVVVETSHWAPADTSGGWSWSGDADAMRYIVKRQFQTGGGGAWHDFATFTTNETTDSYPADGQPSSELDPATAVRAVVKPVYPAGAAPDFIAP